MKVRAAVLDCPSATAPTLLTTLLTTLLLVLLTALMLVPVLLLAPAAVAAPRAGAWSNGPCPTASGVTVVVDFQELGGGVVVRCAAGSPGTGFQALDDAGIPWSPTVRFPGFLCRIDGRPADQPCQSTPPTTAYWSYWNAVRGGTWCYGNFGAGNRRPPEGTVEGWSFSLDRTSAPTPRFAPPPRVPGAPTTMADSTCAQAPPSSTTQPPPTSAPSQPGVTSPPAGPATGTTPGRGAGPPPAGVPGTGTNGAAPIGITGTDPVGSPNTTPTVLPTATEAPAPSEDSGSPSPTQDGSSQAHGSGPSREETAAGAATTRAGSGSGSTAGSPTGLIAALVIVAALSVTSAVVRRRVARTAEQP